MLRALYREFKCRLRKMTSVGVRSAAKFPQSPYHDNYPAGYRNLFSACAWAYVLLRFCLVPENRMRIAGRLLYLLLAVTGLNAADRSGSDLKTLFEAHDWFKLRRLADSLDVGDFHKGEVACAFHDIRGAERYFRRVIASGDTKLALDAHGQLAYMYMRTGQHRKTYEHLSAMQRLNPEFSGLKGALALFSALSQYHELSVRRRRVSRIRMTEDFLIPVSVNGNSVSYGFDTGANLSMMSEAEAVRLGMRIHEASGSEFHDGASGNTVPIRFVVVERLTIGGFELQNAVFSIMPDTALPFREMSAGKQGILGLPALLALESIGWDGDRMLQIGYPSAHRQAPNLCFDAAMPVVEAFYAGQSISAWLDTGSSRTYLTRRFLRDFRDAAVESSSKHRVALGGVGGRTDVDAVQIPEVKFAVGGSDIMLRPADVLLEQQNVDRNSYHVWLGMDLLVGRRVVIDFRSMTVSVGPAAN